MLSEAFEWLRAHSIKTGKIHETLEEEIVQAQGPDGPAILRFTKPIIVREIYHNLEDFIRAVPQDSPGQVMVNDTQVEARIDPRLPNPSFHAFPLLSSEPMRALFMLCANPLPRKAVWTCLLTDLSSAVDGSLLALFATLKIDKRSSADFDIADVGIGRRSAEEAISVTWTDKSKGEPKTSTIPANWTFELPVYRGVGERLYQFRARLIIDCDGEEPLFSFNLIEPQKVMEEARADIVARLRKEMPDLLQVYLGEPKHKTPIN